MKRMSDITNIKVIAHEFEEDDESDEQPLSAFKIPPSVEIYEINGPLFFGVANQFDEVDRQVSEKPKVRILRFRDVPFIDSTGVHALKRFYNKCKNDGIRLIVTSLHVQPLNAMIKADLYDLIGEENVFSSMREAISRAEEVLKNKA